MGFVKGGKKPPGSGKKKGAVNKGTMRAKLLVAESDDKEIVDRTVAAAKLGDVQAQNLYYRFLRPPAPKSQTFVATPVDYVAPSGIEEARETLLTLGERLAKGEISIELHDALTNANKTFLYDKSLEQERRLDQLEAYLRGRDPEHVYELRQNQLIGKPDEFRQAS
jgi:hypothetical protein